MAAEKREVITCVITGFGYRIHYENGNVDGVKEDGDGRRKRKSHKQYIGKIPTKVASKVCQKLK